MQIASYAEETWHVDHTSQWAIDTAEGQDEYNNVFALV